MAAFQLARRPGARLAVTLLCLAATLVVFAADAWTVAARNRAARAGVQVGAPVVLHVDATSATQLQNAVRRADPSGRYATPVIVQQPPGVGAEPVIAVDPKPFGRIAQWGWSDLRPSATQLAALAPTTVPAIPIKGTTLQLRMGPIRIDNDGPASFDIGGPLQPMWLRVSLRRGDGSIISSDFGPLVNRGSATTLTGFVSCAAGCTLIRLGIERSPVDPNVVGIDANLKSIAAGAPGGVTPIDLRGTRDWASVPPPGSTPDDGTSMEIRHAGAGLEILAVCSTAGALAQHLDVPVALPALVAGPTPDARDELDHIAANNLDGQAAAFTPVGHLPLSPELGAQAMIVDLTLSARSAGPIASAVAARESDPMVWLARADGQREKVARGRAAPGRRARGVA
jgi:putative ABC transport system permease protein